MWKGIFSFFNVYLRVFYFFLNKFYFNLVMIGGGCPVLRNKQGQARRSSGQLDLTIDVPVHCGEVGLEGLSMSLLTHMIRWSCNFMITVVFFCFFVFLCAHIDTLENSLMSSSRFIPSPAKWPMFHSRQSWTGDIYGRDPCFFYTDPFLCFFPAIFYLVFNFWAGCRLCERFLNRGLRGKCKWWTNDVVMPHRELRKVNTPHLTPGMLIKWTFCFLWSVFSFVLLSDLGFSLVPIESWCTARGEPLEKCGTPCLNQVKCTAGWMNKGSQVCSR